MPRKEQPLVPDGSALVEFAVDLRKLRASAGGPTYRTLAAATHFSSSTLAAATGGQRLPSLVVTLALVRACGGDAAEWERRWHRVAALVHEETPELPPASASPYAGLAPYRQEDAALFFGRDDVVADLLARLERHPVVALFGASGAGKSSTLLAGLLPRLADRTVVVCTPGEDPWRSCAQALAEPLGRRAGGLREDLRDDPAALGAALRELVAEPGQVVLVVDQFEELFTLCAEAERSAFIEALGAVGGDRCRVVLGVRADFYPHCAAHPGLVAVLREGVVPLGSMSAADLRRAVTGPANAAGCAVEVDLVAHLVSGAAAEPGVLPLLSHALAETWRRRKGNTLTLAGFQATGGLAHALANTAETVHNGLTEEQRGLCRQLFRRLTAPGEGTGDTKRRVAHTELDPPSAELAERFTTARLLVADEHGVELAHEALLSAWPRLRGWLVQDRDGLRVQRDLSYAATEWDRLDRDPGALYRGVRLAAATDWAEREKPALSPVERDFLDTSTAEAASEGTRARRQLRRTRLLAGALVVLLVAVTGIAVYALDQRRTATSRQLNAEALLLLGTNTEAAMRRALEAYGVADTEQARSMLLLLANTPPEHGRATHNGPQFVYLDSDPDSRDLQRRRLRVTRSPTTVPEEGVRAARFSPKNPRKVAYLFQDKATLVDMPTGSVDAVVPRTPAGANDLAIAADGQHFWLQVPGEQIRQWDFTTSAAGLTLPVRARLLATDRTGRFLVTVDEQGQSELWDAVTGASRGRGPGGLGEARVVSPHQDGRLLAVGEASGRTTVYDLERGTVVRELADQGTGVRDLAYGVDPNVVVVAQQGRIRWWDTRGSNALTLSGERADYLSVSLDPTGRVVLGVDSEGISMWDQRALPHLAGAAITGQLVFSADGQTLRASTETQQLAWPLDPPAPYRATAAPPAPVTALDREHTVALVRPGEAAQARNVLWDLGRNQPLGELPAGDGTLSQDGVLALVASGTSVRLHRVADLSPVNEITTGPLEPGSPVVLSPDNRYLAWIRRDGPAVLRELETGREHELARAKQLSFAPGGRHLLTIAEDGPRVWATGSGEQTAHLPGLHAPWLAQALSPDGRTLVLAGAGRAVEVWDLPSGTRTATLDGPQATVHLAVWNDEGTVLATAGSDSTVLRWDLDVSRAVRSVCRSLADGFGASGGTLPEACEGSGG